MSKDFIEKRIGGKSIDLAVDQHRQLSYFTTSKIQKPVTETYLAAWADRNYTNSNEYFLNWVKSIFKTENFLSFFKYYREPNAAAKLINGRIKEPLKRVFYAEDSYFRYIVRDDPQEQPEELKDKFENKLFDALLFRHNDIAIHDLEDVNKPFREIIEIDKVRAIESKDGEISRIAYHSEIEIEGASKKGYVYMDAERYSFYEYESMDVLIDEVHDLGECPAFYLSDECFGDDDVVRANMFSYVRVDLEEYVFLKTLQKMTEPNGAIPVAVKLKTTEKKKDGKVMDGSQHAMSASEIAGRQSNEVRNDVGAKGSETQAGTVVEVPIRLKANGEIDTSLVQNFLKYHYTPIEALKYLDERIKSIEQDIIVSVLGDYSEANEDAKNELQVSKSYVSKEDKLRAFANTLSSIRTNSDRTMLALAYGPDAVQVDCFYGSDFFQETQGEIYDLIKKAPNAIERDNLMARAAQIRNRFNPVKAKREAILYKLIPYASDTDFKLALDKMEVGPVIFEMQTRFRHWISKFEAKYGDILSFWEGYEENTPESNILVLLNNLLTELIGSDTNLKAKENEQEPTS